MSLARPSLLGVLRMKPLYVPHDHLPGKTKMSGDHPWQTGGSLHYHPLSVHALSTVQHPAIHPLQPCPRPLPTHARTNLLNTFGCQRLAVKVKAEGSVAHRLVRQVVQAGQVGMLQCLLHLYNRGVIVGRASSEPYTPSSEPFSQVHTFNLPLSAWLGRTPAFCPAGRWRSHSPGATQCGS